MGVGFKHVETVIRLTRHQRLLGTASRYCWVMFGNNNRNALLRDPDGNLVEIVAQRS